jgi:integrase
MPKPTVSEYAEGYLRRCQGFRDIKGRKSIIGHFVSALGKIPIDKVRKGHIDIWVEDQLKFYKTTTVNGQCKYATRMMQDAIENGVIDTNPFNMVRKPRAETRGQYLSYTQEELIIEGKPLWFRAAVVFSVETGVRQGEIIKLQAANLDLKNRMLRLDVRETKGGRLARTVLKPRSVPLTDRAMEALGKSGMKDRVGLLFKGPMGGPLRPSTLQYHWVRATEFLSPERPVWHDLRHTWATRATMAGVDVITLQAWAGWSSIQMAQRYNHIPEEHLRTSADKMENLRKESA